MVSGGYDKIDIKSSETDPVLPDRRVPSSSFSCCTKNKCIIKWLLLALTISLLFFTLSLAIPKAISSARNSSDKTHRVCQNSTVGSSRTASPALQDLELRAACNLTDNPDFCFGALTASVDAASAALSPLLLVPVSVSLALRSANSTYMLALGVSQSGNGSREERAALKDCLEVMSDSIDQIGNTGPRVTGLNASEWGSEEYSGRIMDARVWLSAALTDQNTCTDGFGEIDDDEEKGDVTRAVTEAVSGTAKYVSMALAFTSQVGDHLSTWLSPEDKAALASLLLFPSQLLEVLDDSIDQIGKASLMLLSGAQRSIKDTSSMHTFGLVLLSLTRTCARLDMDYGEIIEDDKKGEVTETIMEAALKTTKYVGIMLVFATQVGNHLSTWLLLKDEAALVANSSPLSIPCSWSP